MERLPAEESDAYFRSRPRGSRIGAHVSEQSAPLRGGRAELEERAAQLQQARARGLLGCRTLPGELSDMRSAPLRGGCARRSYRRHAPRSATYIARLLGSGCPQGHCTARPRASAAT